jgi:hypothetical protein
MSPRSELVEQPGQRLGESMGMIGKLSRLGKTSRGLLGFPHVSRPNFWVHSHRVIPLLNTANNKNKISKQESLFIRESVD